MAMKRRNVLFRGILLQVLPNRIRIDKIENYQELISEFKQIRDDYYKKVKQTIVSGSVFCCDHRYSFGSNRLDNQIFRAEK